MTNRRPGVVGMNAGMEWEKKVRFFIVNSLRFVHEKSVQTVVFLLVCTLILQIFLV
jgi:hypothetical protein